MKRVKGISIMISVLVLLSQSLTAFAQKHTVSGYVTDSASGEPLIGAAVVDKETGLGTVTSTSGFYSLSLEPARRTLVIIYLGYRERTESVDLFRDVTLNIAIEEAGTMLSEAVVTAGSRSETGVLGTQMSAIEVPVTQIKSIPAIGGEVDVIKALQLLPGVQSGSEGTAGIYVRGGGADENLLLMDGVPLYNVNHLFGFFSVFNADAIKNVTLYKGSFPARFGGHLSSVIDVRMNDGNDKEIHGNASIGLISSKFNLEGPLVKGKTTFNISARRTYLDLLAKPIIAIANRRNNMGSDSPSYYSGGYDFYDVNAKITHRFSNNDRLSLSFYGGDDVARISMESNDRFNLYDNNSTVSLEETRMNMGWKWGNMVAALRWSHAISPKLYLISGANYTRYRNDLSVGMLDRESLESGKAVTMLSETEADLGYNSLIDDISVNEDFEWRPDPLHEVKFGTTLTYHTFRPNVVSMAASNSSTEDPDANISFEYTAGDKSIHTKEAAFYCEDNWAISSWLKANLGLRSSLYNVNRKTYASLEPRISARALVTGNLSFKASYTEMSQYIHLLSTSNLSLPSDLWVPVTNNVKPMRSRQTAAGLVYDPGKFECSIEGYYKGMDNVLEYRDGSTYMATTTGWEEKVCMGRGWAYGLELFVQKKTGKTTGWIGYTWAKSMRQFDRKGNIINDGRPFPAKYDRRHDLSATVSHAFSDRFDISATFVYASGNCGSLGFDNFPGAEIYGSGSDAALIPNGRNAVYLPNRNNYRMPSYNRMDIGMNFRKPHRNGSTGIWNISVYNVYNRKNPYLIMSDSDSEYDPVKDEWTTRKYLKQISIFPIIPSVSYTYKF